MVFRGGFSRSDAVTLGAPLGGALDGFGHVFAGEDDFRFVRVGSAVADLELVFPRSEVVVLDVVADHFEIESGLVGVEAGVALGPAGIGKDADRVER